MVAHLLVAAIQTVLVAVTLELPRQAGSPRVARETLLLVTLNLAIIMTRLKNR
jgi:hypothetical protein